MPSSPQTITLKNELSEIERLAEFVDAFCEPLEPPVKDLMSIHLALEEAVTNVINHGYNDGQAHTFAVELESTPERRVKAVITDDAPAYDPLARLPVDTTLSLEERQIGGLGVHLVKKLMDSAHYERRDGKNILTFERQLGPPS